jgi:hypothetical protein
MSERDISFFPPLEKGRVTREVRRVGIICLVTPSRQAALADLPLSGGGVRFTPE